MKNSAVDEQNERDQSEVANAIDVWKAAKSVVSINIKSINGKCEANTPAGRRRMYVQCESGKEGSRKWRMSQFFLGHIARVHEIVLPMKFPKGNEMVPNMKTVVMSSIVTLLCFWTSIKAGPCMPLTNP